MADSLWPNDVVLDPRELTRTSPHQLVCFLMCPFEPREVYDEVHAAVALACKHCAESDDPERILGRAG